MILREEGLILSILVRIEKKMAQLDDDVAALTAGVATLTTVVQGAIEALGSIANTSSDDAAVQAANAAIAQLTSQLQAATPAAPVAPSTPAS